MHPWFSQEIAELLHARDTAWNKAHTSGSTSDWKYFRHLRNKCLVSIRNAKSHYYVTSLYQIVLVTLLSSGEQSKRSQVGRPHLYPLRFLRDPSPFLMKMNNVIFLTDILLLQVISFIPPVQSVILILLLQILIPIVSLLRLDEKFSVLCIVLILGSLLGLTT